jgi:hypothetical protein
MRGEPGNPGPPRTCTFSPRTLTGGQLPDPWDAQLAAVGVSLRKKLAQPVTVLPRGYDMTSLSNPYLTQVQRILHFTPRENHVPSAWRSVVPECAWSVRRKFFTCLMKSV